MKLDNLEQFDKDKSKRKYKGFVFDLDGTIVDSVGSIASCANERLKEAGLDPQPVADYRFFAGDGQYELIKRALRAAGDDELKHYDSVMSRYIECFKDTCHIGCKAYDGMKDTLIKLKESGYKIAVFSNKAHENTVKVIEYVYGKDFFDIIRGQKDDIPRKPDPQGLFMILEELNLKPEEIVYVGDTCVDMKTGKSAGVYTVGVTWGFRDKKELEQNHADKIIEYPNQLLSI